MKKIIFTSIFAAFSVVAIAQVVVKPLSAEFKYNDETIHKAIADNNVNFMLTGLSSTKQMDDFAGSAKYYKDYFIANLGTPQANGEMNCAIHFSDTKPSMGILMRLFVSNGISEVTFDGKKMPLNEFFSKFINGNTTGGGNTNGSNSGK